MGPKEREIKRRLRVLEHAEKIDNVRMNCRYFGLSRSTFYRWKTRYDKQGESGLANKSTAARNHPRNPSSTIRIFFSDENLRRVLRRISLTRLVVFDMLILKLLCFSLKIAEVSLCKWAYLVSRWLTPHTFHLTPDFIKTCSSLRGYPNRIVLTS